MSECFACWREAVCEHQLPPGEMHAGKPICAGCAESLASYDHPKLPSKWEKWAMKNQEGED